MSANDGLYWAPRLTDGIDVMYYMAYNNWFAYCNAVNALYKPFDYECLQWHYDFAVKDGIVFC